MKYLGWNLICPMREAIVLLAIPEINLSSQRYGFLDFCIFLETKNVSSPIVCSIFNVDCGLYSLEST